MLVQDIIPPKNYTKNKSKKNARRIPLGQIRDRRFVLSVCFMLVLVTLGGSNLSTLVALGEGNVAENIKGSIQAVARESGEVIADSTDVVQGILENGMAVINPNINQDTIQNQGNNQKDERLGSETIEKLKIKKVKSIKGDNVDRFAMASLSGDVVEIVDENNGDDPYLKLDKWGGEAMLKMKIPQGKAGAKNLVNDDLKIINSEFEVDVYPKSPEQITEEIAGMARTFVINEDGGVEFDLVLNSIPLNNVFEFPLESHNLSFYYQPELNAEHPTWSDDDGDGQADSFRSEMVIGSYAVYYKDQAKNLKSESEGVKYKTGKAFHIYRPKVSDSSGNEIWGSLFFDESREVLSVTVDRAWLDSAKYPVRVDPNVGYTSIGASTVTTENYIAGSVYTMNPVSKYINSITVYSNPSATSQTFQTGIYRESDVSLVANSTSSTQTPAIGAAWRTVSYTSKPFLTASTNYIICIFGYSGAGTHVVHYDAGTIDQVYYQSSTFPTWLDPMNAPLHQSRQYSIYATYSDGGYGPGVGVSGGGMLIF
jgi:hypothetical protein